MRSLPILKSLSARRAWIEIAMTSQISVSTVSLSARRAWIEMLEKLGLLLLIYVALRKESVDRNRSSIKRAIARISRSPQGERG